MTDYSNVFQHLLQNQDHFNDSYDKPTVLQSQEAVIEFSVAFPTKRDLRLKIMSDLVGRKILTTKDLRIGEIKVLMQMLKNHAFIRDTMDEYGIGEKA